jgi:hypothetical protein
VGELKGTIERLSLCLGGALPVARSAPVGEGFGHPPLPPLLRGFVSERMSPIGDGLQPWRDVLSSTPRAPPMDSHRRARRSLSSASRTYKQLPLVSKILAYI